MNGFWTGLFRADLGFFFKVSGALFSTVGGLIAVGFRWVHLIPLIGTADALAAKYDFVSPPAGRVDKQNPGPPIDSALSPFQEAKPLASAGLSGRTRAILPALSQGEAVGIYIRCSLRSGKPPLATPTFPLGHVSPHGGLPPVGEVCRASFERRSERTFNGDEVP